MRAIHGEHIPYHAVAETVCEMCIDESLTEGTKCVYCGTRCSLCKQMFKKGEFLRSPCSTCALLGTTFEGPSNRGDFCEWLFDDVHKNITVFAHNAKGYDYVFLLHFLIHSNKRQQIIPEVIYNGSKIMCLCVEAYNMNILDSMNFLPCHYQNFQTCFLSMN
jgi:hypothetical protein